MPKQTSGMCTAKESACICRAWSRYCWSTGPKTADAAASIASDCTSAQRPGGAEQDLPAVRREARRIVAARSRRFDEDRMRQLPLIRTVGIHEPDRPVPVAGMSAVGDLAAVRRPDRALRCEAAGTKVLLPR